MQSNYKDAERQVVVKALRPFGTIFFSEINTIASRYGAINLSQGPRMLTVLI